MLRNSVLCMFAFAAMTAPAAAHASDFLTNRAFQLKLLLIMLAAINAALFHAGVFALWFSVIACGRLLAYV